MSNYISEYERAQQTGLAHRIYADHLMDEAIRKMFHERELVEWLGSSAESFFCAQHRNWAQKLTFVAFAEDCCKYVAVSEETSGLLRRACNAAELSDVLGDAIRERNWLLIDRFLPIAKKQMA